MQIRLTKKSMRYLLYRRFPRKCTVKKFFRFNQYVITGTTMHEQIISMHSAPKNKWVLLNWLKKLIYFYSNGKL